MYKARRERIAKRASDQLRLRLASCSAEVRGQAILNIDLRVSPQRYQHGDPVDGHSLTLRILSGWLIVELENCHFDRDSLYDVSGITHPRDITVARKADFRSSASSTKGISKNSSAVISTQGGMEIGVSAVSQSPSEEVSRGGTIEFGSVGVSPSMAPSPHDDALTLHFSNEFVAAIGQQPWLNADIFRISDPHHEAKVRIFLEVMGNKDGVDIMEAGGIFAPRSDNRKNLIREALIRHIAAGRWPLIQPMSVVGSEWNL